MSRLKKTKHTRTRRSTMRRVVLLIDGCVEAAAGHIGTACDNVCNCLGLNSFDRSAKLVVVRRDQAGRNPNGFEGRVQRDSLYGAGQISHEWWETRARPLGRQGSPELNGLERGKF